jgi:hypothetical protein
MCARPHTHTGREGIQGPPGPAFSAAERDAIRKAIGVLKRVGAEKVRQSYVYMCVYACTHTYTFTCEYTCIDLLQNKMCEYIHIYIHVHTFIGSLQNKIVIPVSKGLF